LFDLDPGVGSDGPRNSFPENEFLGLSAGERNPLFSKKKC
jgi:hypothetical protein